MSGAGGMDWHVSSWGWLTDENNVQWRQWSVSYKNERIGFILTEVNADPGDVLVMASQAWELFVND